MHAAIELVGAKKFDHWKSESNYVICLSVKNIDKLNKLKQKLYVRGGEVASFYEPDLGNKLTAISFIGDKQLSKVVSSLPLALKQEKKDD